MVFSSRRPYNVERGFLETLIRFSLGELSGKVQIYNQEALGIEGKNTVQMPVYSVDAEEADKNWMDILNDILKQCGGFLKKKFMYIVEQNKTGEKKDEKRRNR